MGLFRKGYGASEHARTEALSAYLDGQLSPAERKALEGHLGTCGQCQWDLQTLRTTVQWTTELPAVPVPRAFTIPVPAEPAREPRWRWSLPVLQAATAVVALLFVFSVAGDLMLRQVLPASAPYVPRGEVVMQEAPAADEVAEALPELEVLPQPEPTLLVERAVAAETPIPYEVAPAADWVPEGEAQEALATNVAEARTLGGAGVEAPAEEEVEVTLEKEAVSDSVAAEPPPAPVGEEVEVILEAEAVSESVAAEPPPAPAAEAIAQATGMVEPTPTPVAAIVLPTVQPTPTAEPTTRPPTAEPTVIAEYHEPVQPAAADELRAADSAFPPSLASLLSVAEVVLGVTFILLATLTIALTLRRLRTR